MSWFTSGPTNLDNVTKMENREIARLLSETADLMEIAGEDSFRIRSYRNGASAIEGYPEPVAAIVKDPNREVTEIPGIVFATSTNGHITAHATEDGRVLWDFNTMREFTTVNGVQARGGSIDGPGAVIVNGMVFISSGYPRNGGVPGNVLLASSAE